MEHRTGRTIILSGGDPFLDELPFPLPEHDEVIAADGGLAHAERLGLRVDLVVGDMDSASERLLTLFEDAGARLERHPVDKDETDLELALAAAIAGGAARIAIVGAHTGRLDHLLGAIGLFAATIPLVDELTWLDADTLIQGCGAHSPVVIDAPVGTRVSLVPTGVDALGVVTAGLHWNLDGETLPAGSTRGVSNVLETRPATVSLTDGTLLVISERTLA